MTNKPQNPNDAYIGPIDDIITNSAITVVNILAINESVTNNAVNSEYEYTHHPKTGNLLILFNVSQKQSLKHHDEYFVLEDVPGDNVYAHLRDSIITNPSASANRIVQRLINIISEPEYKPTLSNYGGDFIVNKLIQL